MKLSTCLVTLFAFVSLVLSTFSIAADVEVEVDENGVILAGHDAVAYFTENAPVEGSAQFSAVYNDAIYYFSSAANRDTFKGNPAKYAPQYGGFCAYGAALGKKFDINGKAFEVVDGKLYVNKNLAAYAAWKKDKKGNITKANKNWKKIKSIPASEL